MQEAEELGVGALRGDEGVEGVNLKIKCKLEGPCPLALPRSRRACTPLFSLPKMPAPKEGKNSTQLGSLCPGLSARRGASTRPWPEAFLKSK